MNRGVTGLRPPPGGAQPAQMVTSFKEKINVYFLSTKVYYFYLLPKEFLSIVEPSKVLVLSKELNRRL